MHGSRSDALGRALLTIAVTVIASWPRCARSAASWRRPGWRPPHVRRPAVRERLVPQLYGQFLPARPAFWRLNGGLLGTAFNRRRRIGDIRRFAPPVRVIFGARDRTLNPRVARNFAALFPNSELHLLDGAGHYVQVDQPQQVADLIARE